MTRPGRPVPLRDPTLQDSTRQTGPWRRPSGAAGLNPGLCARSDWAGSPVGAIVRTEWSQSRAIAVAATLLLHIVLAAWLLSLPPPGVATQALLWIPKSRPPPPPPRVAPLVIPAEPIRLPPLLLPEPEPTPAESRARDWYGNARAVAGTLGHGPERRIPGSGPAETRQEPKPQAAPTVFRKPLHLHHRRAQATR